MDRIQLVAVVSALVLDLMVLGAMVARIGDVGFSPNRTAALGINLVLLVNLAGAAWLSARFLTRRTRLHRLERWQTTYLPVFALWAADSRRHPPAAVQLRLMPVRYRWTWYSRCVTPSVWLSPVCSSSIRWGARRSARSVSVASCRARVAPGSWHRRPHPDWRESEPWDQNVSSYAIDDGERLLLFDPLGVPSEIEALAAERETAIVLTAPWHERDCGGLVERLGVPVYTPLPDSAQYLMDMYGLTAEQAGDGSPDVVWLLAREQGRGAPVRVRRPAAVRRRRVPRAQARTTSCSGSRAQRAVISGDTLVDFGQGLEINARWLQPGVTREEIAAGLRPLLELPVEHVLATHGGPTDRAALERALSPS